MEGVLHEEDVVWFDVTMQVALSLHSSEEWQHHPQKVLEFGKLEVCLLALSLANGLGKIGITELHDQSQLEFASPLVFPSVVVRDLSLKGEYLGDVFVIDGAVSLDFVEGLGHFFESGYLDGLVRIATHVEDVLDLDDCRVVALSDTILESEVALEGGIADAAHLNIIWQLLKLAAFYEGT